MTARSVAPKQVKCSDFWDTKTIRSIHYLKKGEAITNRKSVDDEIREIRPGLQNNKSSSIRSMPELTRNFGKWKMKGSQISKRTNWLIDQGYRKKKQKEIRNTSNHWREPLHMPHYRSELYRPWNDYMDMEREIQTNRKVNFIEAIHEQREKTASEIYGMLYHST